MAVSVLSKELGQTKLKVTPPVLLVGFRPLFICGIMSAIVYPIWWAMFFYGLSGMALPSNLNGIQWHAHEMFFGFGGAILGGFLLTASKNWLGIRGLFGYPLLALTLLWILERATIGYYSHLPEAIKFVGINAYLSYLTLYLIYCFFRYRKKDSYSDNILFSLGLPLLILAKNLVLVPEWFQFGWSMSLGVFRLAFVIMFERTLTQFMKGAFGLQLYRNAILDTTLKWLALLLCFESFFQSGLSGLAMIFFGLIVCIRWLAWKPHIAFKNFGIGVSYLGLLFLGIQAIYFGLQRLGLLISVGSVSIHIFSFLCMGFVIGGMIVRIAQGHTGRKLIFSIWDKIAFGLLLLASLFRLLMTQVYPGHYGLWILFAGILWALSFTVFAIRFFPFFLRPRIDGKEH